MFFSIWFSFVPISAVSIDLVWSHPDCCGFCKAFRKVPDWEEPASKKWLKPEALRQWLGGDRSITQILQHVQFGSWMYVLKSSSLLGFTIIDGMPEAWNSEAPG